MSIKRCSNKLTAPERHSAVGRRRRIQSRPTPKLLPPPSKSTGTDFVQSEAEAEACLSLSLTAARMGNRKWSRAGGGLHKSGAGPLLALRSTPTPTAPLSTNPPANVRLTSRHALLLHPRLLPWRLFVSLPQPPGDRPSRPTPKQTHVPALVLNVTWLFCCFTTPQGPTSE